MRISDNAYFLPLLSLLFLFSCQEPSVYDDFESIQIIRDKWGVPHIVAPTDEEVAYGLAWAQCEDDFNTIQEQMLALKGKLGSVKGKEGIIADFAIKFMGVTEQARARYKSELSPKVVRILEYFAAGINAYASTHRRELLSSKLLPIKVEEVVAGYLLGLVEISNARDDLLRIMDGSIVKFLNPEVQKGSNAIAINHNRTSDNQTYIAINSHQPLEGWYSWYEAHLISEEGQNILGGTFPGGAIIFHGVNENLGWAHTVNNADFSDVFQLKMHPKKKLHYEFDGEWYELEKRRHWAQLKLWGPIQIPILKITYKSLLGTTFKTKNGFFAWRFQAKDAIKAVEQWYRMNRANNFDEFAEALKIRGIPCTNLVYADRSNTIYFLGNGTFPGRKSGFDWTKILPGYTSDVFYTNQQIPFDSLPQVLNPSCGFVFNSNNTPYSSTCAVENPRPNSLRNSTSFMPSIAMNNRSRRFLELISDSTKLSYDYFKRIKYDRTYPTQMITPKASNLEDIFKLDEQKYTDIADAILLLKNWDRKTNAENESALFFILCYKKLWNYLKSKEPLEYGNQVSEEEFVEVIRYVKSTMLEQYQSLTKPLGDVQRHIRGDVDIPIGGGPDVLAAIHTKKQKDGRFKATAGESYIVLARFSEDALPQIETIRAYGASAELDSPHYTDQMQLFADQKLKRMTLDMESVIAEADTIYHPLRLSKE